MAKKNTKEILDEFFKDAEGTYLTAYRKRIDNEKLYNYEKQIGKELISMDADECIKLLEIINEKENVPFMTAHSSSNQMKTIFRRIFDYYSDKYELINNPFNDRKMKTNISKNLKDGKTVLNLDYVNDCIKKIHTNLEPDQADYVELIILLFYCGFADAKEIVTMQPEMVNQKRKTVCMNGKTIYLSDRCLYLLTKFHEMYQLIGNNNRKYALVSWHGSYFKFKTQKENPESIDHRTEQYVCDFINRTISTSLNRKYNTNLNYSNLYWLGFYDYLVGKYGKEETKKILTSVRDQDDVDKLVSTSKEYGVKDCNISHLKNYLMPYID